MMMDKVEKAVLELGGEWPKLKNLINTVDGYAVYASHPQWLAYQCDVVCTYPEFMEARKRLENKPSWDDAPDGAKWLSQNDDGEWRWNWIKPEVDMGIWDCDGYEQHASYGKPFSWRQSLEPRPQPDHKEGEGVEWDGEGLPPVGTQCGAVWLLPPDGGAMEPIYVRVVAYDVLKDKVWLATSYGDELIRTCEARFYPRVSRRDKCIEGALEEWQKDVGQNLEQSLEQCLGCLYDAGFLRLPNDKEGE